MKNKLTILSLICFSLTLRAESWKKHGIEPEHKQNSGISSAVAADWKQAIVVHNFAKKGGACFHSTVMDVDGDGDKDLDMPIAGLSSRNLVWYENTLR